MLYSVVALKYVSAVRLHLVLLPMIADYQPGL